MKKLVLWLFLFSALLIVNSCTLARAWEPENAEQFVPPDIYLDWWNETQNCTGLRGNFHRIRWFSVPEFFVTNPLTLETGAAWWGEPHSIWVSSYFMLEERLIRHEMVHDLLGSAGTHDSPFFLSCIGA